MTPTPAIALLQTAVLIAGASFFLVPIATPLGLTAALAGIGLGCLVAARTASQMKPVGATALGLVGVAAGLLVGRLLLAFELPLSPTVTLTLSDVGTLFLIGGFGAFTLRFLTRRVRGFAVLEFSFVVACVAHAFAAHRHERIHQPRVLSDFAWMNGLDPQGVLAAMGVAVVVLAAVLLLQVRSGARALLALLFLVLFAVISVRLTPTRPHRPVDDNDLGLAQNDNQSSSSSADGGSSGRSGKPPDPVAVALLQDDLPDTPVLYFRQAVRSRLVGDKLEQETSGQFDVDVPLKIPDAEPLRVDTTQAEGLHENYDTSMFLLVDHTQLPGVGHPTEFRMVQNPDPRRFVAAYEVRSAILTRPLERLFGRQALPETWSDALKEHYLALPNEPRYRALADRIVREVDPRFVGDDVMKAFAIKQYLEKKGFYSLAQKQLIGDTPTASFLFGDMRGYCVHFAHAATFLLRSQGIPARVALGYGVQTLRRGAGSAVLIFGQDAHAWPELYLDGVGWVTFDIVPEQSDEPPRPPMEQEMEVTFGELARKDPANKELVGRALDLPWGRLTLGVLVTILVAAYSVKWLRRLRRGSHAFIYRSVLDRLSDIGMTRHFGESRERFALRVKARSPSFERLTSMHLRCAFGTPQPLPDDFQTLAHAAVRELDSTLRPTERLRAWFNPFGWLFTR
jgi:transglutaminase-like putative cysteine protease